MPIPFELGVLDDTEHPYAPTIETTAQKGFAMTAVESLQLPSVP